MSRSSLAPYNPEPVHVRGAGRVLGQVRVGACDDGPRQGLHRRHPRSELRRVRDRLLWHTQGWRDGHHHQLRYREREIAFQLQASGAQALIVHHTLAGAADLALSGTEQVKERILIAEGADVAPSFCLRPRPSDYTTNLNLSTKVLDVIQCEGLWAWATTPTMPPYHIDAVADFGEPDRASHISKTVLSIVKFGGAEGIRTPDPLLAKQVLSRLSYGPSGLIGARTRRSA